jgi:crossover junction endodeoxyribonuclease RuvC
VIVIGVDPGVASCGLALVDVTARGYRCIRAVTVRTSADLRPADRSRQIVDAMLELGTPDAYAVEEQAGASVGHFQRRTTNAAASRARDVMGAIDGVAAVRGVKLVRVSPQRAKAAVGAARGRDKASVKSAVRALVADVPGRVSQHASDAIAIAVAGAKQVLVESRRFK